jgi:hypothetical protein
MTPSRGQSRLVIDDDSLDELADLFARGLVRILARRDSPRQGLPSSRSPMALLSSTGGGAVSSPRKEADHDR